VTSDQVVCSPEAREAQDGPVPPADLAPHPSMAPCAKLEQEDQEQLVDVDLD